jgi:transposase
MPLHSREIPPVPEEMMQVARAAFPRGNVYMRPRDELGIVYHDQLFAAWSPDGG